MADLSCIIVHNSEEDVHCIIILGMSWGIFNDIHSNSCSNLSDPRSDR